VSFPGKDGAFLIARRALAALQFWLLGFLLLAMPRVGVAQIVVVDDLGRQMEFEESPCRVVSLIPAATEIVFALGAESCLVGRSMYDDHPAGVEDIPDVGQAIGASVERVLSRSPDLLLLVAGSDNARTVDQFQRLGVPSLVLRFNRLDELRNAIHVLGRVLEKEHEADSLWSDIDSSLTDVQQRVSGREVPSVYYDIANPPPITVGAGSYLDSLITIAGGRNVFGDVGAPSPTVTLESIVLRDPEVILHPVSGSWNGGVGPGERPQWSSIAAVRSGNVREVDADLLHRLGPRIGEAARHLATVLHPEIDFTVP
jgi:ABC-type Fe3+-hydroxamate transport system substrate-binding protein